MNSPTNFVPPQSIVSNGQITGNPWQNPTNIFLVDGDFVTSDVNAGAASDFIVGNFNINIPVGSIIQGIEVEIIGKVGATTVPPISLTVEAYDNTNAVDVFYPYTTPITTLSPTVSTIIIGSPTYLFGTTWTVDQINNLKLAFIANGNISLDSVLAKVYFVPPATETLDYNSLTGTFQPLETITDSNTGATAVVVTDNGSNSMTITNVTGYFQAGTIITGGTSGATAVLNTVTPGVCIDCSNPIQVQAMYLALPFLIGQSKFYLKKGSFAYPNGTPVQPGDVGSCGGTIPFVFDEGKNKADDGNFEENALLDTNNGGTWSVLQSGIIEVDLGSVNQRALDFKGDALHVAALMSDHNANSKVIISNNQPYNISLVRRCQVDTVFSPPITVQQTGVNVTTSLHKLNFIGPIITAVLNGLHNINVALDVVALANSAAFITALLANTSFITSLITVLNTTGGITVVTDGTTIDGNGTPGDPIRAIGTGMGNVVSINGDATPAQTIIAGAGISVTDNGTGGHTIATTGTGSGEVLEKTFTQAAHGFTVGQVLKSSGVDGEFALAESDVAANADVIGIVTSVPTANTFVLTAQGYQIVTVLPGGTVTGDNLYLSDSVAGALTLTDPAIANVPGTISKPLGTVINDSTGLCLIFNQRGQEQQSTPISGGGELVYSDFFTGLSSGVQTIPHGYAGVPSRVEVSYTYIGSGAAGGSGYTSSNGIATGPTDQKCFNTHINPGSGHAVYSNGTAFLFDGNETFSTNTGELITLDATNVEIDWTNGSNFHYLIKVFA